MNPDMIVQGVHYVLADKLVLAEKRAEQAEERASAAEDRLLGVEEELQEVRDASKRLFRDKTDAHDEGIQGTVAVPRIRKTMFTGTPYELLQERVAQLEIRSIDVDNFVRHSLNEHSKRIFAIEAHVNRLEEGLAKLRAEVVG